MPLILLVLIIGLPLAELYLIVAIGRTFGVLPTLAGLIAIGVAGACILRRQGLATLRRVQADLERGRLPAQAVLEGVILVIAGVLLVVPGFITDVLGCLALVAPLRRALAATLATRQMRARADQQRVYEAEYEVVRERPPLDRRP